MLELDIRVDGLDSSNLQTQITTNPNGISALQTNMQDKLTAGSNISITGNVISSSGGGSITQADLDLKQNVIDSSTIINCDSLNTTGNLVAVDCYLAHLLCVHVSAAGASRYSFCSFRIGFACCLLAAGCPYGMIQALARWRPTQCLATYARLNTSSYAG
jgi:hypothetical protein